jgi:hypothetical protein
VQIFKGIGKLSEKRDRAKNEIKAEGRVVDEIVKCNKI